MLTQLVHVSCVQLVLVILFVHPLLPCYTYTIPYHLMLCIVDCTFHKKEQSNNDYCGLMNIKCVRVSERVCVCE